MIRFARGRYFWAAGTLAAAGAWLYFKVFTISLGPHVILEPWLINQGFRLYDDLADHHSPLMPLFLAAGQRLIPDGLLMARLALAGLVFLIIFSIYFTARSRSSPRAGLVGAAFFLLWSQIFGYGNLRHETFLTPLYLMVIAFWGQKNKSKRTFAGLGLLVGLAFLIKQHALVLFVLFLIWEIISSIIQREILNTTLINLASFVFAFFLPAGIFTFFHLLNGGTLYALWYWVFGFVDSDLAVMLADPPKLAYLLVISPALLAGLIFIPRWRNLQRHQPTAGWQAAQLPFVLAASLVLIFPRFNSVHLEPFLAVLAVLSGIEIDNLLKTTSWPFGRRYVQIGIACILALSWLIVSQAFSLPAIQLSGPRKIWEFSNLPSLAAEIRQQVGPTACIYLLPEDEANSNLYYLLGCTPPRPWAFTSYPWYSRYNLPAVWLQALKSRNPEWILYFPGRWNVEKHDPALVQYCIDNYSLAGKITSAEGEAWLMKHNSP